MSRLTATKNGINNVYQLSRVELENLVIGIIKEMHYNEEGTEPDSDRQWDSDTTTNVNLLLLENGLVPSE